MAILVGIPVLALAVILQSTVFSRVALLNGTVDVVLIVIASWSLNDRVEDEWVWALMAGSMVGFVSAIPFWTPILVFLLVTAIGVYLKRRVWQIPVLALFVTILFGTVILHLLSIAVLSVVQAPVPLGQAFNLIILPGLLLNLLAAIPIHGVVREIAAWLYPKELEE